MNTVTLIGSLTRDPEMRKRGETKVCDMRVAESYGRKESPLYINISVFGRQAEVCNEYLNKGRQVAVTGQLRFREWKNDEGQKRSEHTIAADRVDFLTSNGNGKRRGNGDGEGGGSRGGEGGRGREEGGGRRREEGRGREREEGGGRREED